MQTPPGCFGSMIAYDHKTPFCQRCFARVDCQARVAEIRPTVIKLLDRFNDVTGKPMSYAWLTRGERAQRKRELQDQSLIDVGLAHEYSDNSFRFNAKRAARKKIDPRTCNYDVLATLSPNLNVIVSRLRLSATTLSDLVEEMRERRGHTHGYALRAVHRELSFLKSMGRARRIGQLLELQ